MKTEYEVYYFCKELVFNSLSLQEKKEKKKSLKMKKQSYFGHRTIKPRTIDSAPETVL